MCEVRMALYFNDGFSADHPKNAITHTLSNCFLFLQREHMGIELRKNLLPGSYFFLSGITLNPNLDSHTLMMLHGYTLATVMCLITSEKCALGYKIFGVNIIYHCMTQARGSLLIMCKSLC